jgi:hypothetical protein
MEKTIENQLKSSKQNPFSKFTFLSSDRLKLRKPEWLVENILESNSIGMIYGKPASGKSFLGLDLGACVASGMDWHGNRVKRGGVLYFVGEGLQGIVRRKSAWETARGASLNNSMFFSNLPVDLCDKGEVLPSVNEEIHKISEKLEIKLLVVDTLSRHYSGDENVAGDMAEFIAGIDFLKNESGCAVLLVHHSGKDDARGARGSSALLAALDTEILVKKTEEKILMTNTKQKDFELFDERAFRLTKVPLLDGEGKELVDDYGKPITSCVLEETEVPVGEKQSPNLGIHQQSFKDCFEEMSNQGQQAVSLEDLKSKSKVPVKRWTELMKSKYVNENHEINGDSIRLRDSQ